MPTTLNHAFAPRELIKINSRLSTILDAPDTDELVLEKIVDERANLVESLLNTLDEQQKRCFAAYELKANDAMIAQVEQKRSAIREALSTVSKSSKAIKKYHQV